MSPTQSTGSDALDDLLDEHAGEDGGIPLWPTRVDVAAFRRGFRHLREPVTVVRFGHAVGVYAPVVEAAIGEPLDYEAAQGAGWRAPRVGSAGWSRLAYLISALDDIDVALRMGAQTMKRYRRLDHLRPGGRTDPWYGRDPGPVPGGDGTG